MKWEGGSRVLFSVGQVSFHGLKLSFHSLKESSKLHCYSVGMQVL